MPWNDEAEEFTTTEPGDIVCNPGTLQEFKLAETPDTWCPHCGAPLNLGVDWGEDPVREEESFVVRCWSCGETHKAVYAMEPRIYKSFRQGD